VAWVAALALFWASGSASAEENVADPPRLLEVEAAVAVVADAIVDATVSVRSGVGRGSGVVVEPGGLVLTAAHVAGRSGEVVMVGLRDGRTCLARTLGCDYPVDICMVRIEEPGPYPFAPPGEDVAEHDWVLATGHPGGSRTGRDPVLRIGRVLGRIELPLVGARILTDAPVVNGDSGGPVFDLRGRVIGIHASTGIAVTTLNAQHAPLSAIRARWDSLLAGAEFGSPLFVPGAVDGPPSTTGNVSSQAVAELPEALRKLAESGTMRVLRSGEGSMPGLSEEVLESLAIGGRSDGGESEGGQPPSAPRVMSFQFDPDDPKTASEVREALLGMAQSTTGGQALALRRDRLRDSAAALNAVAPIVREASTRTVEVISAGAPVALGMVVAGGRVVTKASDLDDAIEVRMGAARYPARLIARDDVYDLALLRVDGMAVTADLSSAAVPAVGRWMVTPDADGGAAALGVVSHAAIESDLERGNAAGVSLGLEMARAVGTARIADIRPDGPAAHAGLLAGDVIKAIDGHSVTNAAELDFRLLDATPSVPVRLEVVRDGRTLDLVVEPEPAVSDPLAGSASVAFVSSLTESLSARRDDFPLVFLHDSLVPAARIGGPVLDAEGRVVGLNIARVDRSTTAAIPIEQVRERVRRMQAGF